MNDDQLRDYLATEKSAFGVPCKKLTGATTVQALRKELIDRGLAVSDRDVYIRRIPVEFDLLVVRPGVIAADRVVFEPGEVSAAIEVKYLGSFGPRTLDSARKSFSAVCAASPGARCLYVTVFERRGYKGAINSENLGYAAYTLFEYTGSEPKPPYNPTGDWGRLLHDLTVATPNG